MCDQPATAFCPRMRMLLAKSPDATGSSSSGGSTRLVFWKL
jgi:hypothetical protein